MRKPIIAIFTNIEFDKNYLFPGYPRIMINQDYVKAIEAAGGVPILIGPTDCYENLEVQLALCDGVLFSGGQDVNPLLYNEQPSEKLGGLSPIRDAFEFEALKTADKLNKPIMGICRGAQLINVWYGGTLYQDNSFFGTEMKHVHNCNPDMAVHDIQIEASSFLHEAMGITFARINSFHHQSIKQVAPGFKAVAKAPDGIVEAIEKDSKTQCVIGVQWHPEMMQCSSEEARQIFRYFVKRVASC